MTGSESAQRAFSRRLRVLLVEDSEDDVELIVRELRRGGFEATWQRVDTAQDLSAALSHDWDLITCDWMMPAFDAPAALAVVSSAGVDVPVIIVSGQVGEEFAVSALKSGAHDFVSKQRLARLVPAVSRELREAEERRARKRAEQALRESEQRFATIFRASPVGISISRVADGRFLEVNGALLSLYGYSRDEMIGHTSLELGLWVDPRDRETMLTSLRASTPIHSFHFAARRKSGEPRNMVLSAEIIDVNNERCVLVFTYDMAEINRP